MPVIWDPSISQTADWVISEDGLTVSQTYGAVGFTDPFIRANTPFPDGKWYFEVVGVGQLGARAGVSHLGDNVMQEGQLSFEFRPINYSGFKSAMYTPDFAQIQKYYPDLLAGDVLGIAFDATSGKLWGAINNVWLAGDPAAGTTPSRSGITGTLYPSAAPRAINNDPGYDIFTANFGATPTAYAPPVGFSLLDAPPPKTMMLSSGWSLDVVQPHAPTLLSAGWSLETIQPRLLNVEFTNSIEADPVWTPVVTAIAYRLKIETSGYDDLVLPMSSFQTRLRQATPSYMQVIVPAALDFVDEIEARSAGDIVIERGVRWTDGTIQTDEIARVNFGDLRIDQGSVNSSATLTGHKSSTNSTPKAVTLSGAQLRSVSGLNIRYRCEIDNSLSPGDTALINGDEFIVNYIQHVVSVNGAYMEITNNG